MAEEAEDLRAEIQSRRERMSGTVDQIENRVSPSRSAARGRDRVRGRMANLRSRVMGDDDSDRTRGRVMNYSADGAVSASEDHNDGRNLRDRARSRIEDADDPREVAQRQAKGNPAAAGMISFGFGLLLGSVLPGSRTERELASDAQPQLRQVAEKAGSSGQEVAGQMQGSAEDAAKDLKDSASEAADDVRSEGKDAAAQMRDQQRSS